MAEPSHRKDQRLSGPLARSLRKAVIRVIQAARPAARRLARASTQEKNKALRVMASRLQASRDAVLAANAEDVSAARAQGLSVALIDRLTLTPQRLDEMIQSIESVRNLPDPVGDVIRAWRRPNGLEIRKVRVPLGVIGIIYESRPNVTSECASLCVKSGNAVVLRGGAESFHSNETICRALREALIIAGLPEAAVSTIPVADRAGVDVMLQRDQDIDVIIPRGGEALIRKIVEQSRIPVIKHAKGVCHVYVDEAADAAMARAIVVNAKCQRPATCNAMETLLVHERIAPVFLPDVIRELQQSHVEIRGCEATRAIVPGLKEATEDDWSTEYLDLILSVKVVRSLDEAVEHISRYGSAHSDAIVTRDDAHARRFTQEVDSAAVYVNASTRLTDGFQFGLGAEIGISTDRLHARGPMGLEELTTYKYIVVGSGQLRE
ncbi:MAG: glutamate-5-semialdehyde dehydrogenase [Candidatus Omnitrophica bacterium]|nr:glutamate-5-semialdehyde dehydrogenase [Candidatus Omnitrophota bacterium]